MGSQVGEQLLGTPASLPYLDPCCIPSPRPSAHVGATPFSALEAGTVSEQRRDSGDAGS